jgi:hypothetical protein
MAERMEAGALAAPFARLPEARDGADERGEGAAAAEFGRVATSRAAVCGPMPGIVVRSWPTS